MAGVWSETKQGVIGGDMVIEDEKIHVADALHVEQNDIGKEVRAVAIGKNASRVMKLVRANVSTQVYFSVALTTFDMEWIFEEQFWSGQEDSTFGFVMEFPKENNVTVTSACVSVANGNVFESHVIDGNDAIPVASSETSPLSQSMATYKNESGIDASEFNPDLFCLPFHGVKFGERVAGRISVLVNLSYDSGYYSLELPLAFSQDSLGEGNSDVLSLDISFSKRNDCSESLVWKSEGFDMTQVNIPDDEANSRVHLELNKASHVAQEKKFKWSYLAAGDNIECLAFVNDTPDKVLENGKIKDVPGGVCAMMLSPPLPKVVDDIAYPRDVVFIFDRSGSMGFTNSIEQAKEALSVALDALRPQDRFSICCFDDRQVWFGGSSPKLEPGQIESLLEDLNLPKMGDNITLLQGNTTMSFTNGYKNLRKEGSPRPEDEMSRTRPLCVKATETNISLAKNWVKDIQPGGLTDIITPMSQAFWGMFNKKVVENEEQRRLRTIFVITDGAVENERAICQFASRISSLVRIFCFGIGVDCNSYFLHKLASIGRGYSDVCFLRRTLKEQMLALFSKAKLPVLTDLSIQYVEKTQRGNYVPVTTASMTNLQWCPDRAPDLYAYSPVVISCAYDGSLPDGTMIYVCGTLVNGNRWQAYVPITVDVTMPLRTIFAQQSVDQLVADAWLADTTTKEGAAIKQRCVGVAVAEGIPCPFTQVIAVEQTAEEFNAAKNKYPNTRERRLQYKIGNSHAFIILGASLIGVAAFGSVAASMLGGIGGSLALDAAGMGEVGMEGGDEECCACEDCGDCEDLDISSCLDF